MSGETTKQGGRFAQGVGRRDVHNAVKESDWLRFVIDLAHHCQWSAVHFRSVPRLCADGSVRYSTPVQGDGAGFPDLLMVRPGQVIAAELKGPRGRLTERQEWWIERLKAGGMPAYVWRPANAEELIHDHSENPTLQCWG